MQIFIKFFLTLTLIVFFIACEDVNTLCINEGNQTVDSNETDDNSTSSDDNDTESDDNVTIPDDGGSEDNKESDDSVTLPDLNTTLPDIREAIKESEEDNETLSYIQHNDIDADIFWIGEESNSSAWDDDWVGSYGGEDAPDERDIYHPSAFSPSENPFYVALPYNDLGTDGNLKSDIKNYIPWANKNDIPTRSICKNRWLKISANRKEAYGQWEDVGPIGDNDINYVFDTAKPLNNSSGISLSPATKDYLGVDENSSVNWEFIDDEDVPDGPWRDIVTRSNSK